MANRMLGKLPPVHRPGAMQLAAYLPAKRIPVPAIVDNHSCVSDWGMMKNDELGDCTCAAAGHAVQAWTAKNGREIVIADDEILKAYEAVSGYDPATGANDNGAVEADVLDYWMNTGFNGHKLDSYAVIETRSRYQMQLAMYLFGDAYTGIALPLSAQEQKVWSVVHGYEAEFGSWGGHAVPVLGYDDNSLTCITWGAPLRMTWAFQRRYMDEAYAPLSIDWVDEVSKAAPNGLLWDDLKADLEKNFRRRR
jgi:hypothetical protein